MSFNAGAIVGDLQLNTSGFTHGILEAQSLSSLFPSVVTSFLVNPLLGLAETATRVAEIVKGAVEEIGHSADNMGEAAEKAGVSVEFLTGFGAAFSDAGSSVEGLADSLKFVNRNAAQATEGAEQAVKAFKSIGIGSDFLKANLNDTEKLFRTVVDRIAALPTPAEKTRVAMELLGRGGADAIAAINKGSAGLDDFAATVRSLGGGIDTNLAQVGDKFGTLETLFGAAWQGIKKAIAEPILQLLADNFDQIVEVAGNVAEAIRGGVAGAFELLGPLASSVWEVLKALGSTVGATLVPVFEALAPVIKIVADLLAGLLSIVADVLNGIASVVRDVTDAIGLTDSATAKASSSGRGKGAGGAAAAGELHFHAHVDGIDAETASSVFADKALPHIREALGEQTKAIKNAATKQNVSSALKGKR